MNLMTLNQATTLTMSSREIAELTGKQHSNVMRDIRAMEEALGVQLKIESYKCALNRDREMYSLDKEHTLCLVSGYNVTVRCVV